MEEKKKKKLIVRDSRVRDRETKGRSGVDGRVGEMRRDKGGLIMSERWK